MFTSFVDKLWFKFCRFFFHRTRGMPKGSASLENGYSAPPETYDNLPAGKFTKTVPDAFSTVPGKPLHELFSLTCPSKWYVVCISFSGFYLFLWQEVAFIWLFMRFMLLFHRAVFIPVVKYTLFCWHGFSTDKPRWARTNTHFVIIWRTLKSPIVVLDKQILW